MPATITESLSKNGITFKLEYHEPYPYDLKEKPELCQLVHDLTIHKGAFVAVPKHTRTNHPHQRCLALNIFVFIIVSILRQCLRNLLYAIA